ncbi:hypothetical protein [Ferrimonas marina]|uniref:Uncharacterized protein n=1 Tax=Ferrimonas marina TaxID=299255 RepID=A0A1M5R573_9GAMM|nr:hypothetical protein [Ferrimonas marina]SHH21256.1 hypothetical protein SAMN02745129_1482 [Ferrimonas marina]
MKLYRLLPLLFIAGCSSKPEPADHAFRHQLTDEGTVLFTLSYFGNDDERRGGDAKSREGRGKGGGRGGRGGERGGPGGSRGDRDAMDPEQHAEMAAERSSAKLIPLLESELDQRGLCLEGYEILEQRPTAKGIALQGQCPQG